VGVMRGAVPARMRHIAVNGKEAARAFPIKRGRRRGAAHLLSGFGLWFSRRPRPTIMGCRTVASPVPPILPARHASPMPLRWQAVEAGNRAVADWGSGSVVIPCAFEGRIG
jgi:hypothetical protein